MELLSIRLGDRTSTALADHSIVIRPPDGQANRQDVVFYHGETDIYGVASGPIGVGAIPEGAAVVAVINVLPQPIRASVIRLYAAEVEIDGERYHLTLPRPFHKDRHSTVYYDAEKRVVGVRHADPPNWPEPPAGSAVLGRIVVPGIGS